MQRQNQSRSRTLAVHLTVLLTVAIVAPQLVAQETETPTAIDSAAMCGSDVSEREFVGQLNANASTFDLEGGLSVILKRTPGNPVVSVRLFIDGGSRSLTAETAGIEQLALNVATDAGTASYDKVTLAATLEAMGSGIGFSTHSDYSSLSMSSLRVFVDQTFPLFRSVIHEPLFPDSEIELARERHLTSIRQRVESPDSRLVDLANAMIFAGHPYDNRPQGTEASVQTLTRDQLMAHYSGLFDNSQMLLVVVGDLDEAAVRTLVGDTFANFPSSGSRPEPPPALSTARVNLQIEAADLPTNYIRGITPAPAPTHADYPAMVLAANHLSDRLFEEVRTRHNLAYAAAAGISSRLSNYMVIYVTSVAPEAVAPLVLTEMQAMRTTPLTDQQLTDLISVFITEYYMAIDSNSALANTLGWWELYGGGRENADDYVNNLRAVTAADIQRVANTYFYSNFQYGIVGPTNVELGLFAEPPAAE